MLLDFVKKGLVTFINFINQKIPRFRRSNCFNHLFDLWLIFHLFRGNKEKQILLGQFFNQFNKKHKTLNKLNLMFFAVYLHGRSEHKIPTIDRIQQTFLTYAHREKFIFKLCQQLKIFSYVKMIMKEEPHCQNVTKIYYLSYSQLRQSTIKHLFMYIF